LYRLYERKSIAYLEQCEENNSTKKSAAETANFAAIGRQPI
jgi:hypothetical protein